uniref:Uncharacterized protein n=1 Tax=Romanomermis culicivorax TaxID=13658 RepID=A0A915K5G3_ROMCU
MLLYGSEPIKANEGQRHKNAPALDIIQLLNKMKNSIFCTLHSSVGIDEVNFIVLLINGITKVEYSGRLTDLGETMKFEITENFVVENATPSLAAPSAIK